MVGAAVMRRHDPVPVWTSWSEIDAAFARAGEPVMDWWPPYFWLGAEADGPEFRAHEYRYEAPIGVWRSINKDLPSVLPSEQLRQARVAAKRGEEWVSLYADICRDTFADEDEIYYDRYSKTWTIPPMWGLDTPLTGVPSKEMALAICRALYASWVEGSEAGCHS